MLGTDEWVLHAADQDLPCLAEVGMRPPALYDTELAGRLAGFDRVNLAAMVQRLLGLGLAKGHGAADWSKRPLPAAWLNYAALDVEVLLELRHAVAAVLAEQGKADWAAQDSNTSAPSSRSRPAATVGAARRGSTRCATGACWPGCASCGRCATTSPGDATSHRDGSCPTRRSSTRRADPKTTDELLKLPVFRGPKQRRSAQVWLDALAAGREDPDPPHASEPQNGPPPAVRWSRRKPEAAARLEAARAGLGALSEQLDIPTENLVAPDLVRRLCWDWTPTTDAAASVEAVLRDGGARAWQRELTVPVLAAALVPS